MYRGGFGCRCPERSRPVTDRKWVVVSRAGCHRLARYSSEVYSTVHCLSCGATGRSRSRYVGDLPDGEVGDGPIDT